MNADMKSIAAEKRLERALPVVAIVGLCMLNYGWGLAKRGIHSDDWFWFAEHYFGGFQGVVAYGAIDRLLIGVPFGLMGESVGLNPTYWHIAVVVLHICAALLVWRLLQTAFPADGGLFSLCAAALFAIHPTVSVVIWVSRLPSVLSLVLFLLSLYLSVSPRAQDGSRWFWWGVALVLSPVSLLIYELPLVLEPVRLLLMLGASRDRFGETHLWISSTLRRWLPFAFAWILFLVWRLVLAAHIVPGSRGLGLGWPGLPGFISGEARGVYQTLIYAWRFSFGRLVRAEFSWQPWRLGAAAIVLFWVAARSQYKKDRSDDKNLHLSAIVWGGLITVLGISVTVAAGFPVPTPASLSTRVNSATAIGAAIMTAGGAAWGGQVLRLKPKTLLVLALAALIGLGTANNCVVNRSYVEAWGRQRDLWWQIAWRAPDLAPGTYLLVASRDPLSALDDDPPPWAIGNPLAFIYGRRSYRGEFLTEKTLARLGTAGLEPFLGSELVQPEQILVVYHGDGCVKFADPMRSVQDVDDTLFARAAHLSNLDNVLSGDLSQARTGLGTVIDEPSRNWCYFYQRAEYLARQRAWMAVADTLVEAEHAGFEAQNTIEWLPFIEAYLYLGDEARVARLLKTVDLVPPHDRAAIRDRLAVIASQADSNDLPNLAQWIRRLQIDYLSAE